MSWREGVIVRVHGGHYYVLDEGREVDCVLPGRLKKERQETKIVAIGDRVRWSPTEAGTGVIEEVLPRHSVLSRTPPPPRERARRSSRRYIPEDPVAEQVLMANPDLVLVVFSLVLPYPNPLMLDRYLVACEAVDLPVLMVANKIDLVEDEEELGLVHMYREVGYEVLCTSAETGEGVEELRAHLRDKISVLTGPSGVGKSALLNALWPELRLETGEVSEAVERGRHTTVVARLLTPEPGILVADTPGLRTFRFWDIEPEQLEAFFPEFRPYLNRCAFAPCTHIHEPGCAVLAAAERGEIPDIRYESYARMFEYGF